MKNRNKQSKEKCITDTVRMYTVVTELYLKILMYNNIVYFVHNEILSCLSYSLLHTTDKSERLEVNTVKVTLKIATADFNTLSPAF